MNNDDKYVWRYNEILQLRESLLYFGLNPETIFKTHAELWIAEKISMLYDLNSMWILLQYGWNMYVDDSLYGLGLSFIRQNKIKSLLNLTLIPLSGYTIDILSYEYLDDLKNREELSSREVMIKRSINELFDTSSFPPPLQNFGYY
jgi:hypothetical protein